MTCVYFVRYVIRRLTRDVQRTNSQAHHLRLRKPQRDDSRSRNARTMKASSSRRGTKWTRPKYGVTQALLVCCAHICKVADAVKRYSYLLGQTDLFRHFVDMQVRSRTLIHSNTMLMLTSY